MGSKTLVIAVDNSKECLKALDFALQHLPNGYTYYIVHMQPRPYVSSIIAGAVAPEFAYQQLEAFEKEMTAASNKIMDAVFIPKAKSAGAEACATVLKVESDSSSHIGTAICDYAEKVKAVALILMRQNKSAVSRFFMGSVTKFCAVHSTIPVIIVPETD
ncbi:g9435 [Coccomyxa elongata]